MLTLDQAAFWRHQGYLVLPGFKSRAEVQALRERAQDLVEAWQPSADAPVFSTTERSRIRDAALLDSAEAIQCFFEEEAFDADGARVVPKNRAVNKIGHALHELDAVFERFSHGPELAALAADLGCVQPQVWQSTVVFKQPHIGGEVKWHQDATFFATEPQSLIGLWFALEDADRDNGCLWMLPGGHRGPLRELYIVNDEGRLEMQSLDATPWPAPGEGLPIECEAGTLVVFDGLTPHYSSANRSPRSRAAYTLHASSATATYSPRNWLQRKRLPLRGFD
jgi:phytanoyl-CoA hydroxylase